MFIMVSFPSINSTTSRISLVGLTVPPVSRPSGSRVGQRGLGEWGCGVKEGDHPLVLRRSPRERVGKGQEQDRGPQPPSW